MTVIREQVDNPELILSAIAVHAVLSVFGRFMKDAIDASAKGLANTILTEILASFIFVACIFEKGLWLRNVNEMYFHVATGAQCIYWMTHLPGKANPLPILASEGVLHMIIVLFFQIVGGLGGAAFITKVFWPQGFVPFHQTLAVGQCTNTLNTDFYSAIAIESGLVLLLSIAPIIQKKIGNAVNLSDQNSVLIGQAVLVSYVVKTFIGVTGAMMNPLLSVVVNFHCLNTPSDWLDHMALYWAGPMAVVLLLGLLQSSQGKAKME